MCEDADLELAINLGVALKVGNIGQICVAPNRFLVHASLMEAFVEGMTKKFAKVKIGFVKVSEPEMGLWQMKVRSVRFKRFLNQPWNKVRK